MVERHSVSSLQTRNGVEFYRAPHLEATGQLIHAFSTRLGGVSRPPFHSLNLSLDTGDKAVHVRKNRKILADAFGLAPSVLLTVNQVHEDEIRIIDSPSPEDHSGAFCDAMITDRRGIAIGVLTADCVPILLLAPETCTIAAIHVGWKGTALNLCGKTIRVLAERFGADPENLMAAVGPSIGPCCYEVDEPLRSIFSQNNDFWDRWAQPSASGRWGLDLQRASIDHMTASGVRNENIVWFDVCTRCQEALFFSYRRDGGITGRQMAFIMLK